MRPRTILSSSVAALTLAAMGTSGAAMGQDGMPAAPRRPASGTHTVPHRAAAARPQARTGVLPVGTQRPTSEVLLSIGQGELITLPANVSDVWTSNPAVADVYVNSPRQIHLFGKSSGEATVFATNKTGQVVYATNVNVNQNITSIDRMLRAAMPDAALTVTTAGQIAVLTGTVASPADSAQAASLVTALLNPGVDVSSPTAQLKVVVINRVKTATPLQVNLQVRIAEVSRSFVKNIGVNLQNRQIGSGAILGIQQGRQGTIATVPGTPPARYVNGAPVDANGVAIPIAASGLFPGSTQYGFPGSTGIGSVIGLAGKAFGMDLLASLDLGETDGQVTTLANPNLTAISGETGSFLAGGEIPIPIAQGLGAVSIDYKQYGISLAFTPTVLADGRISLRVRPEVSQLSAAGSINFNGVQIPGLLTRRAETTVELGSGQSFMIAGLMQNDQNNQIDKTPGLGDLPVVGALLRSNAWKRNETELVIVVTPYLVKPVNANEIALPTDGYKAPSDVERVLLGTLGTGQTGGKRPVPTMAPTMVPSPASGLGTPIGQATPATPVPPASGGRVSAQGNPATERKTAAIAPGFTVN